MVSGYTLLTTFAVHHLVIGATLLLCLWLLFKLVNFSAEVKSWLWLTAFLVSTLVPLAAFIPDERVEINISNAQVTVVNDKDIIVEPQVTVIDNHGVAQPQWNVPESIVAEGMMLLTLFLLIWLLGSLWRFAAMVRSYVNTRKVLKTTQFLSYLSRGGYPVAQSYYTSAPMVVGLVNPVVILPAHIVDTLDQQYLLPVIEHEIAHIKRGDLWVSMVQEIVAIVFWWSPVMRQFNRHVHVNRELACDFRAIKVLNSGKQYAQSLLECAKLMVTERQNLLAVGLFSRKKELTERIDAALVSKHSRSFRPWQVMVGCVFLAVTAVSTAQNLAPKINIDEVVKRSKHYSQLARADGEALINAVLRQDTENLEFLVKVKGIDIDTPAIGDGTALIIAVKENMPQMVDLLMDLGADVDQSSRGDGNPLIMAAMTDNLEMAKKLLNYNADVNAVVMGDETALINATRRGSMAMTELLVNNGADVNLKVRTGWSDGSVIRSPLNMARNAEVKAFLRQRGATP